MGQILRQILDWFQLAELTSKLWQYFKAAWWCPVLAAIMAFLYRIDWGLVVIGVLFLIGVIAGIYEWRERLRMVREANERAERYKRDKDRTWLQSRSFVLDEKKRKKVIVRFIVPHEQEAKAVADELKNIGWGLDDPIPFYPKKPEFSPKHTVKVELPWGIWASEGNRYAISIAQLTGHKVYVLNDDASDTEPRLEQGLAMRVTVYGPKPA